GSSRNGGRDRGGGRIGHPRRRMHARPGRQPLHVGGWGRCCETAEGLTEMGMTMTEKILARGAGRDSVKPGDLVLAKVDFAMGHDLTLPPAGKIMREQMGAEKIWDPDRVAVTQDHFQPAKDTASATLGRLTREFSRDMGIKWSFEVGQGGICHTVLPENGLVLPGELV